MILIVLEKVDQGRKLNFPTEGPYEVLNAYRNGTVQIQRGKYQEIINFRRIKPRV